MASNILTITDDSFDSEVLQSDLPILVDFWAEWCGPCRMIAPILEQIADEYANRVKITKMNVDNNPQTPNKYGVRGIPNLILFKNGEAIANRVGAMTKSQLSAFLDEYC